MSNFASIENAIIAANLNFAPIAENTLNQVICKNGEIAGFQIRLLPVLGENFQISQIYDCSSGIPVLQGTISVVPGLDLMGGLFSSGCFPDGDPMDQSTKFYQVDY